MATTQLLPIRKVSGSGARCRIGSRFRTRQRIKTFFRLGKGDYGVMQTVETGDWTNPRLCQSIKLANVNGIQSTDIIRFYEGEHWPGISYPRLVTLTEEN